MATAAAAEEGGNINQAKKNQEEINKVKYTFSFSVFTGYPMRTEERGGHAKRTWDKLEDARLFPINLEKKNMKTPYETLIRTSYTIL